MEFYFLDLGPFSNPEKLDLTITKNIGVIKAIRYIKLAKPCSKESFWQVPYPLCIVPSVFGVLSKRQTDVQTPYSTQIHVSVTIEIAFSAQSLAH